MLGPPWRTSRTREGPPSREMRKPVQYIVMRYVLQALHAAMYRVTIFYRIQRTTGWRCSGPGAAQVGAAETGDRQRGGGFLYSKTTWIVLRD